MGKNQLRNIGIDIIGTVPWGTHLCQFYNTKQDLLDILLPFFKTGLENNEFCLWITSEPLKEEEVKEAMRKAVPNFTQYLERGQIEFAPYTEFYYKGGVFNLQGVSGILNDKLNQALSKGYDGMRVTGNTAWVEEKDWRKFSDYEAEINKVIGKYRILSICTYSFDECEVRKRVEAVYNHQRALIKQAGNWVVIESYEYRQLRHDFEERRKELKCLYGVTNIIKRPGITLDELYQEVANLLPQGWQYPEITCAKITINSKEFRTANYRDTDWKQSSDIKVRVAKVGAVEVCYLEETPEFDEGPFLKEERQLIDAVAEQLAILVKGKRIEENLQLTELELSAIYENTPIVMILVDQERRVRKVNYTAVKFARRSAREMIGLYGGEALRCIHSIDDPRGCGFGHSCEGCPVRRIVSDAFRTGNNHYRVRAKLQLASGQGDVTVLVSAILLNLAEGQRVLVCIEDITEHQRKSGKQQMASPLTSRGPLTPLQERFAKSDLEYLTDREAIELLLSVYPCARDRRQKERSLKAFKSIRGLLSASTQKLEQAGFTPQGMFYIKLLREIPARVLREKIIERPVLESSNEIFDYLYYSMRDLRREVLKVVYLDSQNKIIDTEDLFFGTLDSIHIYPREIEEGAIKHNATGLVFVHNHPSGDPEPSQNDKQITRDLVFIGMVMQIKVLDHIIIGENRYYSFADDGLIAKYEDDFLNLRLKKGLMLSYSKN